MHKTTPSNFFVYLNYLNQVYRDLKGMVKINHIFTALHIDGQVGNKFELTIQ